MTEPEKPSRQNPIARAQRLLRLSELVIAHPNKSQGWYAEQLGVGQPAVSKLMADLLDQWRERWVTNQDRLLAEELQRIASVESEAWEAWQKSKRTKSVTTKEKVETKGWTGSAKIRITTEEPAGDAKFLAIVLDCVEKRARLMGLLELNKPKAADPGQLEEQASAIVERIDTVIQTLPAEQQERIRDALMGG